MDNPQALPWFRRLHWQILIAMLVGTIAGLIGGEAIVPKVGWLGTLFIRLLKMVIVPLILTSIISGVAAVGGGRDLGPPVQQNHGLLRPLEHSGDSRRAGHGQRDTPRSGSQSHR